MKKTNLYNRKLIRGFYYRVIDGCGEKIIDNDLWYFSGKSLYAFDDWDFTWHKVSPPLFHEVFELIEGL